MGTLELSGWQFGIGGVPYPPDDDACRCAALVKSADEFYGP
jgi:hypothetical protein